MAKKIKSIMVFIIVQLIHFIRTIFLIPHGSCKYQPNCTLYAQEALKKLPFHKAFYVIIKRILRCNPLSKGGYDPVQ